MVKFEELVDRSGKLREGEKNRVAQEDQGRCNCPPCPTYAQCAKEKGELIFCLRGKSSCIRDQAVCFCSDCPVHKDLGLRHMYYCLRGNEAEQRGAGPSR